MSQGPEEEEESRARRPGQHGAWRAFPGDITSMGASGFLILKWGSKVSAHSQGSLRTREEVRKSSDQGLRWG